MTASSRDAALATHRAGRLDEAERLHRAALAADGRDADALHPLGVVRERRSDPHEGRRLIRAALAEREVAEFFLDLEMLLFGEPDARARRPTAVPSRCGSSLAEPAGLGATPLGADRIAEAGAVLTEALGLGAGGCSLVSLLGVGPHEGRADGVAEAAHRAAIAVAPDLVDAHQFVSFAAERKRRGAQPRAAWARVAASAGRLPSPSPCFRVADAPSGRVAAADLIGDVRRGQAASRLALESLGARSHRGRLHPHRVDALPPSKAVVPGEDVDVEHDCRTPRETVFQMLTGWGEVARIRSVNAGPNKPRPIPTHSSVS